MTKRNFVFSDFWINFKAHHLKNKNGGLYEYMWWSVLKIVALYFIIVIPLILIVKHLIDFDKIFGSLTENFSDAYVLIIFFISESFLGMIPPDIFMIWATKFDSPFLILLILGALSYIGGAISYQIGYGLSKIPRIKAYTERKLERYILLTRKWGGAFIVIAALLPFSPLSMVVIAVGLLKYPFKLYLLFGISRIIRFLFQGLLYSGLFHLDSMLTNLF
jgi:membrane protein YqaA with SNARE-associated domain